MKAVVLAAGLGHRLEPFTRHLAKPMMPVANQPVMEHILRSLAASGIRDIFANLHYRPDDLRGYFGDGSRWGVSLQWFLEPELTGPAGAVLRFAEALDEVEPTLVVSGDALHDIDLNALVALHREKGAMLTVVLRKVQDPGRFGVATAAPDGRIVSFTEKPDVPRDGWGLVSAGIYCVSAACLKRIPRGVPYDFGRHLIPALAAEGAAVYGFVTEAYWMDIGSPEALRQTNLDAITGRVRVALPGASSAPGVLVEPDAFIASSAKLTGPVLVGREARIHEGAELIGPAVVGPGAELGEGSYVSQSVLLAKARVPAGGYLVGGLMGARPL